MYVAKIDFFLIVEGNISQLNNLIPQFNSPYFVIITYMVRK